MGILFSNNKYDELYMNNSAISIYLDFIEEASKVSCALYISDILIEASYSRINDKKQIMTQSVSEGLIAYTRASNSFWVKINKKISNIDSDIKKFINRGFGQTMEQRMNWLLNKQKRLRKIQKFDSFRFKTSLNIPNFINVAPFIFTFKNMIETTLDEWKSRSSLLRSTRELSLTDTGNALTIKIMDDLEYFIRNNSLRDRAYYPNKKTSFTVGESSLDLNFFLSRVEQLDNVILETSEKIKNLGWIINNYTNIITKPKYTDVSLLNDVTRVVEHAQKVMALTIDEFKNMVDTYNDIINELWTVFDDFAEYLKSRSKK